MLCFLLYAMHLSELLVFKTGDVARMVWWIIFPFVIANLIFNAFYALSPKTPTRFVGKDIDDEAYLERVERRISWWFKCWIALTTVEVVFSGGVPIVWLLLGSSKVYEEFGLPFIHVFVSSLLAVLALAQLGLYLLRGDRRRLFIPIFQVLWAVVIISRGAIVVALIQGVVLWLCLKGASTRTLRRVAVIFIAAILSFGYIGDARSGATEFRNLAQPSANYPEWLPSGVLWVYVYVTSPLGNLINTSFHSNPAYDVLFRRTTFLLFPTPIRHALYGKDSDLGGGADLIQENLKVSSAYIDPFNDYGYTGIACFSLLISILSAYFWRKRRKFRDQLLYSIMAQCLILTIFWNFLFYNPFLGQFFWIYLLFRQRGIRIFPRATKLLASDLPVKPPVALSLSSNQGSADG